MECVLLIFNSVFLITFAVLNVLQFDLNFDFSLFDLNQKGFLQHKVIDLAIRPEMSAIDSKSYITITKTANALHVEQLYISFFDSSTHLILRLEGAQ